MPGVLVRVKREVEALVKAYAERAGYMDWTVRNVAILLGLQALARGHPLPASDEEFLRLLEETRGVIRRAEVKLLA